MQHVYNIILFIYLVNECTNDIFIENLRNQKKKNSDLSLDYLCNNSMLLINKTLNSLDLS